MAKEKQNVIVEFYIADKNSYFGDRYMGTEVKIFGYEFIRGDYDPLNKPSILKVIHNMDWVIYGSTTFEKEITKLVKKKHTKMRILRVSFSEQGMQDDGYADMDVVYKD